MKKIKVESLIFIRRKWGEGGILFHLLPDLHPEKLFVITSYDPETSSADGEEM